MKATAVGVCVALFALGVLGGCATPNPPGLTPCPDPRPEVCTRDYHPVCGYAADRVARTTYGNGCEACADPAIVGWLAGACPE